MNITTSAPANAVPGIPVFTHGARILFQGDSITDGGRGRNEDKNHILGHGYAFIIAARYGAAFPELDLTFLNRGCSGDVVENLAERWQQDTIELKPDILSILVGVNDNARQVPLDTFAQAYGKLLADTVAANVNVRLVLGEPFTLPVGNWQDDWFTVMTQRQEIVACLAEKYHAALVRYQTIFDTACAKAEPAYWIHDGVHPTCAGHQLMAEEWVRVVREYWPASA